MGIVHLDPYNSVPYQVYSRVAAVTKGITSQLVVNAGFPLSFFEL